MQLRCQAVRKHWVRPPRLSKGSLQPSTAQSPHPYLRKTAAIPQAPPKRPAPASPARSAFGKPADKAAGPDDKSTETTDESSCIPLIELRQSPASHGNDLSQTSNLFPQHLLTVRCQAVLAPDISVLHFALGLTDQPARQQAVQVGVKRARAELKLPPGLLLHRLHDAITMQVRFRKCEKNLERSRRDWSILDIHINY